MSLLHNFSDELAKNRNEDGKLNNIYKEYTQQLLNALKNTENTFEEQIRIFEVLSELRRNYHIMISEQKNDKYGNMDRNREEKDFNNTNIVKNSLVNNYEFRLDNEENSNDNSVENIDSNQENTKSKLIFDFLNSADQKMANKNINSCEGDKLESVCINKAIGAHEIKNEKNNKVCFKTTLENDKNKINNECAVHINHNDKVSINKDVMDERPIYFENDGEEYILKSDQNKKVESSNNWFKRIFWCFS